MGIKLLITLSVLIFVQRAQAIEPARCPAQLEFTAQVTRVYETSTYSMLPGWIEAQQTLLAKKEIKSAFILTTVDPAVCIYEDPNGNEATFSTARFSDPEEREPRLVDQLIWTYRIDGSLYVSYLPIKSYSKSGLVTYSRPFPVKIKTRIYNPVKKRPTSFDLGMISVTLD